jgi:glycosyltransferase involved in cell wall biosynthesis
MKIGLVKGFGSKNYYGGISVQGRMWKEGLEHQGNDVCLLDNWSNYDWNSFDWIIILGLGGLYYDYIKIFKDYPKIKIAAAPIIDFTGSLFEYGFRGRFWGSKKLSWHTPIYDLYHLNNRVSLYLVRSEHEKKFLVNGLGFKESKVRIVPLHTRLSKDKLGFDLESKDNYVFHTSRLLSYEKNVPRLVEAAQKYGFDLVLAGTVNGEVEMKKLNEMINGAKNIKYIGRLSDNELINQYKKSKVLALPSLIEGVGMVALEAASFGCNIVLTNLGAPKEYFNGKAFLVDPFNIDDIGKQCLNALQDKSTQPSLSNFILETKSETYCMRKLHEYLYDCLAR